jgi:hypothetical protein
VPTASAMFNCHSGMPSIRARAARAASLRASSIDISVPREWFIYSTVPGRFIMGKGITLIGLILYLAVVGAFLVFCYRLVVIVFRNVFGIELPDLVY